MAKVAKLKASQQLREALAQRNGPNTKSVHNLLIRALVLVYRIHKKEWTGLYKLLSIEGETCVIELPSGPTKFRSTVVKLYYKDVSIEEPEPEPEDPENPEEPEKLKPTKEQLTN